MASLFRNGRNQAIRLPRDMEVDADQVLIERHGDVLTIRPRPGDWEQYFATCRTFDPDFPSDGTHRRVRRGGGRAAVRDQPCGRLTADIESGSPRWVPGHGGRGGWPIGTSELLIGCHALHRCQRVLVTEKLRAFERLEGLRLEDWSGS